LKEKIPSKKAITHKYGSLAQITTKKLRKSKRKIVYQQSKRKPKNKLTRGKKKEKERRREARKGRMKE